MKLAQAIIAAMFMIFAVACGSKSGHDAPAADTPATTHEEPAAADTAADAVEETMDEATDAVEEAADDAGEMVEEMAEGMEDAAGEAADAVEDAADEVTEDDGH